MNSSKRTVKRVMRSRKSSKPKFTLGRLSATEITSAERCGGRNALVESEGSNAIAAIVKFENKLILLRLQDERNVQVICSVEV